MKTDLEKARQSLTEQDCTCVICKGDTLFSTRERGVRPLLNWLDQGIDAKHASAADKVVGKATAFLYCLLGVKAVYAPVMSKGAVQVLLRNRIAILWDKQVDTIINRQGAAPCPFEAAVSDVDDPQVALRVIRQKLEDM